MRYWTVLCLVAVAGLSAFFFQHFSTHPEPSKTIVVTPGEWVPTNSPGNRALKVMRAVAARAVKQPLDLYQVGDYYLNEEGMLGRFIAPDSVIYPADEPLPRLAPDILTKEEVVGYFPELAEAIQHSLDHDWHHQCIAAARARHKILEDAEWTVVLRLEGDGSTMRIVKVEDGRGEWPSSFEEDDKNCIRQSFYRPDAALVSWPWKRKETLAVEYRLCIKLRSGVPQGDDAIMHEHVDEVEVEDE